ncbi:kinase-like protein [Hypomontagnella monticulosa]|nr:kinase-like protein [Hypomontagnella monticulosa]
MPARFPDTTFLTQPATAEPQPESDAAPSCRLLVAKPGGRAVWALGSHYILKDRGYYPGSEIEVQNTNFAAEQTEGPVAKIVVHWKEDNRFFLVQERIDGEPLEDALPKLTQDDIAHIGRQMHDYLDQLRHITSPQMQMLDGRPVIDRRLLKPLPAPTSTPYTVCTSQAELAANMALAIKDRIDDEATLDKLMARMPNAIPFTFTHSDVHEGNIMVKDENFVGLIDWELAGFYPRWWEFVNSCEVLSDSLQPSALERDALEWFRVYHAIRDGSGGEETAQMLDKYLSD